MSGLSGQHQKQHSVMVGANLSSVSLPASSLLVVVLIALFVGTLAMFSHWEYVLDVWYCFCLDTTTDEYRACGETGSPEGGWVEGSGRPRCYLQRVSLQELQSGT